MPIATVTAKNERVELKTVPEGYVVIRRMTHGEKLHRRSMTKMKVEARKGQRDVQAEIDMLQRVVAHWEFANLIVEHNLEAPIDPNNPLSGVRPLNFKNPADVDLLDGMVGEEIDTAISDFNNFEADAEDPNTELGNSSAASSSAS